MRKFNFLTKMVLWGSMSGAIVHASSLNARDYTLDLDDEVSPPLIAIPEGSYSVTPDPWTGFFNSIPHFSEVHWGIDLEGTAPLARGVDDPLAPASVMKLVTLASALQNLGPDAKFENKFEAQFDQATKTVSNVKFTVSGDPTWGHPAYESIRARITQVITELKSRGVKQVNGSLTVTSTRESLNQVPRSKGWPARWTLQCMATLPTSFMLNGNCGSFQVTSLKTAKWLTPGVDTPIKLQLTAGSANSLTIHGNFDEFGRVLSYTVSGKFAKATSTFYDPLEDASTSSVPVHAGDHWLQNLFKVVLAENGITYQAAGVSSGGENFSVDLSSLPLLNILRLGVKSSINAILDRTFLETAARLNLNQASDASYALLKDFVTDETLLKGTHIEDGSGLVVDDRLTSHVLFLMLTGIQSKTYFQDFFSALAVSGEPGTLLNRLTDPATKGKIFAKTGTIDGIYNLAGYFKMPSGELRPFAFLSLSGFTAATVRAMIDQSVIKFAKLNNPQ